MQNGAFESKSLANGATLLSLAVSVIGPSVLFRMASSYEQSLSLILSLQNTIL